VGVGVTPSTAAGRCGWLSVVTGPGRSGPSQAGVLLASPISSDSPIVSSGSCMESSSSIGAGKGTSAWRRVMRRETRVFKNT
jgi:hypothetical protein